MGDSDRLSLSRAAAGGDLEAARRLVALLERGSSPDPRDRPLPLRKLRERVWERLRDYQSARCDRRNTEEENDRLEARFNRLQALMDKIEAKMWPSPPMWFGPMRRHERP